MEELLLLNDSLTSLLAKVTPPAVSQNGNGSPIIGSQNTSETSREGSIADGHSNGSSTPTLTLTIPPSPLKPNGNTLSLIIPQSSVITPSPEDLTSEDEQPSPATPRVDKGKARAEPEEEKVLSPSFLISASDESEDEEGKLALALAMGGNVEGVESVPSPTKL